MFCHFERDFPTPDVWGIHSWTWVKVGAGNSVLVLHVVAGTQLHEPPVLPPGLRTDGNAEWGVGLGPQSKRSWMAASSLINTCSSRTVRVPVLDWLLTLQEMPSAFPLSVWSYFLIWGFLSWVDVGFIKVLSSEMIILFLHCVDLLVEIWFAVYAWSGKSHLIMLNHYNKTFSFFKWKCLFERQG